MVTKFQEPPLEVNEMLRSVKDNRLYRVKNIYPGYWGDGATGYQLVKIERGEELLPFWVRPEELTSIYRRFNDRPF